MRKQHSCNWCIFIEINLNSIYLHIFQIDCFLVARIKERLVVDVPFLLCETCPNILNRRNRPLTKPGSDCSDRIGSDSGSDRITDRIGLVLKSVDGPTRLLQFANRFVIKPSMVPLALLNDVYLDHEGKNSNILNGCFL